MPKVYIFAGANGSGKTTFADSTLEPEIPFINADNIKIGDKLSDVESGKKALRQIDAAINRRIDFAFETTMAGKGLEKRFLALKKEKYAVKIYYLFAYPVNLLIERIKERLKRGGHPVADQDVIRRYDRSLHNFWNNYRNFTGEWSIINNNDLAAKTIAIGNQAKLQVIDSFEFNVFKEILGNA